MQGVGLAGYGEANDITWVKAVGMSLLPMGWVTICYALYMYHERAARFHRQDVRSYHDSLGPFVLTAFFMMIFFLTMIYHQTPTPMTPPNPGHGVDIVASGAAHSSASEAPHTSGKGH